MLLHLTELSEEPIHEQIARQLTDRIVYGDLNDGAELIPVRMLARQHHVNIKSVMKAYDELTDWGLVRAEGHGFLVQPLTEAQRTAIIRQRQLGSASPLNVIESMSRALSAVFDPEKLMEVVVETVRTVLKIESVEFVLLDDRTEEYRYIHPAMGFTVGLKDKVIQALEQHRRPLRFSSLKLQSGQSVLFNHLSQLPCHVIVPLYEGEACMGFWALSSKQKETEYTREDLNLLTVLAHQFVTAMVTARFYVEAVEKRRMEEELDVAREIQQGLLPGMLPLEGPVVMAGSSAPSRQVGGDFFDVIALENRRWGVVVADVCGKGLPAAMLAAQMQTLVRNEIRHSEDLVSILQMLNQDVRRSARKDQFVTLCLAIIDPCRQSFRYASAGHHPSLLIRNRTEAEWLNSSGPGLGILASPEFQSHEVCLGQKDTLVMYTDGVTEAMNQGRNEYGENRLMSKAMACAAMKAGEIHTLLIEDVDRFTGHVPGQDDRTLLVLQMNPSD